MLIIFYLVFIFHLTLSDQWYSKSQCTQKEFANNMDINCNSNEFILIGWSHYGIKKNLNNLNSSMKCQPSENDCIMDYTHKIAELCNGVSKCEVILTQQFIHKCSDEATYLFISYQCIQNSTILDVCSKGSITSSNGLSLISPMFPNEYPNNINCTCSIESSKEKSIVIIDVENLSFNLQDNDKLLSFSGTIPFGASLLTSKNQLNLKFHTDETLSQSGFWIRLYGYQQCNTDELTLGSKCLKIFSEKQTRKLAEDKCLSINSKLIHLNDIIQEKKLAYFIFNNTEQKYPTSFWISNEKQKYNNKISWWPWRSSTISGKCVLRTHDGWIKRPCNEEYAFICERDINKQSIPLTVHCGDVQSTTIIPSTTMTSMQRTTTEFIQPILSTVNNKLQKNTVNTNILAAILGGIFLVIFSINIVICYICKRRTENQSKCKTQNDSNSSFTHEELQRSLMKNLYHEKTNTISSTSTSSSSSKQSQSKSNDTTTTSSNLFQLSPPSSNIIPTTLCFRNPHIGTEQIDYHVYETIPSENTTYSLCTNHSAFKPVVQSNTHTIRPYCPRTNILYHHPDSSKQPYDTLSKISPNTMVVMPVCCHHYSSECSTASLRQHVLPSAVTQIYTRSESIV